MDTKHNIINSLDIKKVMHDWILTISKDLNLFAYNTTNNVPNNVHINIQELPGDASIRKYYLLNIHLNNYREYEYIEDIPKQSTNTKQFIIMQTVNNKSLLNFINLSKYLINLNLPINIPEILAIKKIGSIRFLLLSYLGDQLIFNNLNNIKTNNTNETNTLNKVDLIYNLGLQRLTDLQLHNLNMNLNQMNRKYIKKNLNLFKNWYLKVHLNCLTKKSKYLDQLLNNLENYFVKIFEEQPQVFTHIDYHSKNLILQDDTQFDHLIITGKLSHEINFNHKLGVIDFQDAMLGPITYDIASLLQDAYLIWPEELIENIVSKHYNYLIEKLKYNKYLTQENKSFNNLLNNISQEQFLKYVYLTGLQRHIKNLGVFARLKYFYKKPNYIKYIPNLLHYIYNTCNKFNELELINLKNLLQEVHSCNSSLSKTQT